MRKELDDLLCQRYPKIFAERNLPKNQTCMCWGFTHEDGWFTIVDRLCATIQWHLDQFPHIPQVVAKQVKEKFGGLRFYYEGGDDVVDGAVRLAEALSLRTCEDCGTTVGVGQTRHWVYTRCKTCLEKLGDRAKNGEWKSWDEMDTERVKNESK